MLLNVRDLDKSFPTSEGVLPVLRGVSLTLEAGQSLALTGESGSGKSTLLYIIGGLEQADAGKVEIARQDTAGLDDAGQAALRRGTVGLVFQQFNLVPSLTVTDNIGFHARLAGRFDAGWIRELTVRLGLEGLERRYPEDLSGGQQQRVAIGRTLAAQPQLVLADEPTGNLDEATSASVLQLLIELTQTTGAGLLMVTHSTHLAGQLDARLHLSGGRLA